jgi:UDP-glucose:(heptosyl)LPS alpha-1,3-glucosyltransferase
LKIALVRARYSPHGGAERFATRALRALSEHDAGAVDLSVIARRWDADADEQGAAVRFIRCDPFYLGSVWRDASFASAVREVVARESFDLVQSHERIPGLSVYRAGDGVHAAWLERRARAATAGTRLGMRLNPHHRYLVRAERAMFEHPALRAVICNSDLVRTEILARFAIDPERVVLIRNGVDLVRFTPEARAVHRSRMRAQCAIADDVPVFVFVGSGFERKGVAPAIRALAEADQAVLIVVGDDKHRSRYVADANARGVASRVHFVGAVADPLPYYAMADCFVLPTLYDPFPNAALEAFACGLPVITTDACGAAELIDEGRNGWIVDAIDVEPLVAVMLTWIGMSPSERATIAAHARRTALPLSLETLGTELTALYRRLLAAR